MDGSQRWLGAQECVLLWLGVDIDGEMGWAVMGREGIVLINKRGLRQGVLCRSHNKGLWGWKAKDP